MPATSRRQQRFMYAELARKRAGQKTKTGMSEKQLEHFTEIEPRHVQMALKRRKEKRS